MVMSAFPAAKAQWSQTGLNRNADEGDSHVDAYNEEVYEWTPDIGDVESNNAIDHSPVKGENDATTQHKASVYTELGTLEQVS